VWSRSACPRRCFSISVKAARPGLAQPHREPAESPGGHFPEPAVANAGPQRSRPRLKHLSLCYQLRKPDSHNRFQARAVAQPALLAMLVDIGVSRTSAQGQRPAGLESFDVDDPCRSVKPQTQSTAGIRRRAEVCAGGASSLE